MRRPPAGPYLFAAHPLPPSAEPAFKAAKPSLAQSPGLPKIFLLSKPVSETTRDYSLLYPPT